MRWPYGGDVCGGGKALSGPVCSGAVSLGRLEHHGFGQYIVSLQDPLDGTLTAQRYISEILEPKVQPFLQQHPQIRYFQQDNASLV